MKRHILSDPSKHCTGCVACLAVCPVQAIQVELNKEGFYEAFVDEDTCVDCGICQTVCLKYTSLDGVFPLVSTCRVAGCISSSPSVQKKTTSGGIAYEISKWGIENNYKIVGVVYDYEAEKAKTVLATSLHELEELRGSKYLQSDIRETMVELLHDAKSNPSHKYICIGTPCQIYGMRQLFRKKGVRNERLFIDLFCHGVPSYLIWKPYLNKIQKENSIGKINHIQFRAKDNGWHQYTIKIEGDRSVYSKVAYSDLFYRFFFDNLVLNKSCFACEVRKNYVAADLRLGDFLGKHYESREDGVSAVLIASDKGQKVMDFLIGSGVIVLDRYFEAKDCLAAQSTEDYPGLSFRNEVIGKLQKEEPIEKVLRWYFSKLSFNYQLRSYLKRFMLLLPNSVLIKVRRLVRK